MDSLRNTKEKLLSRILEEFKADELPRLCVSLWKRIPNKVGTTTIIFIPGRGRK